LLLWGIKYNPKQYWNARGITYHMQYGESELRSIIRDRIIDIVRDSGVNSFLDIGCGYGYYLKHIEDKLKLHILQGCDISSSQLKSAKKFLGYGSKVVLTEIDGKKLPYVDKYFDMAMTFGVCICIPHNQIESFIKEIIRVTKNKYLLIESSSGRNVNFYFSHDYPGIFKKLGIPLEIINNYKDGTKIYIAEIGVLTNNAKQC
jgi:SAM-dependent methyltransferase